MYGLVNKAVEDLVVTKFGEPTWEAIRAKAGVEVEAFVSMGAYDDSVTYKLVGAASEVLGIPASAVLETFGEHWVLFTAQEGYGQFLDMAGDTFPTFLQALDAMHARVATSLKNLKPPSFWCTDVTSDSLVLHYKSHREGLASLIVGLLRGLGKRFDTAVETFHVPRADGVDHETFQVKFCKVDTLGHA